uniref:Glycosyltransferase family 92 protein n=1 Tax=Haemonchus contortus TaxID=6289 RepID=A0A7I4YK56_HAECO
MVRSRISRNVIVVFVISSLIGVTIITTTRNVKRKEIVYEHLDSLADKKRQFVLTTPTTEATTIPVLTTSAEVTHEWKSFQQNDQDLRKNNVWRTFSGIYVQQAYRVSNKEIRFVYLEEAQNRRGINAFLNGKWRKVKSTCFNETSCEDYLYCTIATRFGSIDISTVRHSIMDIALAAEGSEEFFNVMVKDVSLGENHVYEHAVGVCVQPVFYLADWPLVIQFFESWLAQGATKFYFYYHTYTAQVRAVLEFYKRNLGSDVELIGWSDLPVQENDRGSYTKDPNSRVFRHAAIAFMHDCMLRARSHVKFIANFDLDDFPVAGNGSLPEVLNEINDENVNIAEIIVDWKLTKQKIQWNSLQSPSDLRFMLTASKLVADKSIRYDYRISRKMFTRPERVAVFDMHNVYRNEIIPGESKQYGYVIHSSRRLFILHMRRFQRNLINEAVHYNKTVNTRFLIGLNRKMTVNFRKRIKADKFATHQMAPWATEASEILRNLEHCRKEAFGVALTDANRICQQSSGGCEPMLMTKSHFFRAPMSWTDLAHRATFNNYTR